MRIVTDRVSPDEPCYGMFEGPKMRPMKDGSQMDRWVQQIFVIRGDAIACYETDYGPASDYEDKVTPIIMPSFGDDRVGELQAYAEKNRHDHHWTNRREEMLSESTLIKDHLQMLDEETAQLFNRSVLGPAVNIQRNNANQQARARVLKERRNGKRIN